MAQAEIADDYAPHVPEHRGYSSGRKAEAAKEKQRHANEGFGRSNGEILLCFDADYLPGKLRHR